MNVKHLINKLGLALYRRSNKKKNCTNSFFFPVNIILPTPKKYSKQQVFVLIFFQ